MSILGVSLVWVDGHTMGRILQHHTLALFRRKRRVSKGDVVLVDHPEHGRLIRQVAAVTVNGKYSLRGASRDDGDGVWLGAVHGSYIRGTLVAKLIKGRTLEREPAE